MIIVISNPTPVEQEHKIINALFDEGLSVLHMRKMDYTDKELNHLLMKIDKQHHSKVAFHQHHEMAEHFGSRRLHFTEQERKRLMPEIIQKNRNYVLSTAIHHINMYADLPDMFDYCFLSPIFNSISKPDLKSMITPDFKLPAKSHIKIIALGGVSTSGIPNVKNYNFDGIAVLGTIWGEPEKAISNFKKLKGKWGNHGQQY